ncbi:MAG: hypothetical protein ACXVA9_00825 [Bdellovibrionales bacterium]
MFKDSVLKTVIAMLVTATMAIPAPLWASENVPEEVQADVTDGVPVILQPVQLQDGRTGYIAVVPYPEEQEAQIVAGLAQSHPEHLILGVSGPDDPAIKIALESGHVPWINSFIVADVDQAPIVKKAPTSIKQKLKDKINAITDLCKRERTGLVMALFVSGVMTGYIVETTSVSAGMKAFVALFAWSAWQAMASNQWDLYLEKGGEVMTKLLTSSVSRDVTTLEKQMSETAGKFHASHLANTAVAAWVLGMSGASYGWNMDGLFQAAWYGFLGSTDILDAAASAKVREGRASQGFYKKFVLWRIFAAACFEVAGYSHVPHVQWVLAGTTGLTAMYLALSHRLDPQIIESLEKFKNSSLRTRASAQSYVNAARSGRKVLCEHHLRRKPVNVASQGEPAE